MKVLALGGIGRAVGDRVTESRAYVFYESFVLIYSHLLNVRLAAIKV